MSSSTETKTLTLKTSNNGDVLYSKRGDKGNEKHKVCYFFSNFASKTVFDMLAKGAEGNGREHMMFHSLDKPIDQVNGIVPLKVEFFTETGQGGLPRIDISRRIWVHRPLKLNHVVQNIFKVDLPQYDFSRLLESTTDKDVFMLAAALKLEGEWVQPFQDAGFQEFTFLNRSTGRMPFMTSKGEHYLQQFKNFKLLSLPFKQHPDSNFSMLFYLPDRMEDTQDLGKLIDEFETGMQEVDFPMERARVGNFLIPRFALNVSGDLPHVSGWGTDQMPADSTTSLSTARSVLGGSIEINERGATGTAATAFTIHQESPDENSGKGNSGVAPPGTATREIDFVANRPFLFFIRDDKFGSMLFGGGLFGSQGVSFRQDKQMSFGPWGGSGGEEWVYHPNQRIKKIIIRHGDVIDSITFVSEDGEESKRFGGTGGHNIREVLLDDPKECLTAISGTFERYSGMYVMKSLTFSTNISVYGPFGVAGDQAFSVPMEGGSIVGFHGRAGIYLDAIGVMVKDTSPTKVVEGVKQN